MAKRPRSSVLLRMASDLVPLPREPAILIGMVLDLRDENGKLRATLETLKRTLFGARSERSFGDQQGQLALAYEDSSTAPAEPEQEAVKPPSSDGRSGAKPMRNIGSLPRHLPRVDVVIEPAISCCSCCQGALHRIGEDVSEMLDIVPAILRSNASIALATAAAPARARWCKRGRLDAQWRAAY